MERTDTIGSIVAKDIRTAHVFKQHDIDFCCGGGMSLEKACQKKGVDPDQLINDLELELNSREQKMPDFTKWKAGFLSDYIQNEHHTYVRESIPLLQQYANKVARVHGEAHDYLVEMRDVVMALSAELLEHLMKEENVLFPYIKQLESQPGIQAPFGTVQNPIRMMTHEHDAAGDMLKQLALLSGQFIPPEYACNTWRAYYDKLEEFQEDLHIHIHLENNILFPKAIELEKT